MSGQQSKPLRTRTAEFLRGTSHKDSSGDNPLSRQNEASTSQINPQPMPADEKALATPSKSKRSFLGLGRALKRKSQSSLVKTQDGALVVKDHLGNGNTPHLVGHVPSFPVTATSGDAQQQIPASQFASRFTPATPRSFLSRQSSHNHGVSGDALSLASLPVPSDNSLGVPSPSLRSFSSFDSGSSYAASEDRNTTPTPMTRPPTLTVSLSPPANSQEVDLFEDLFTKSTSEITKEARRSSVPESKIQTAVTNPPSSLSVVELPHFPESGSSDTDASGVVLNSHQIRQRSRTFSGGNGEAGRAALTRENETEYATAHKRRTLASMSGHLSQETPVADVLAQPLATRQSRRRSHHSNNPPSMPLPLPPPSPPPTYDIPPSPTSSLMTTSIPIRSRASTMSSANSSNVTSDAASRVSTSSPVPALTKARAQKSINGLPESYLLTASPDELRQVIADHASRFEELSTYLQKLTEQHIAEKAAMQKRIDTLEKEARKKDKEVKGMRWLVMNSPRAGQPLPSYATAGNAGEARSVASFNLKTRPLDSETDTPASEPSFPLKSSLRPRRTSEHGERSTAVKRSPSAISQKSTASSSPYLSTTQSVMTHRSSGSSLSPSPASSTSSLPSLTPNNGQSGLTVIPESPPMPRPSGATQADAAIALSTEQTQETEMKKASKALSRLSASSMASLSSVSGATMAYASNLKRGRPPSIAQVLEQSPSL